MSGVKCSGLSKATRVLLHGKRRRLPHTHILTWLATRIRSTDIDKINLAEISNQPDDPKPFKTMKFSMIRENALKLA